jgi:hypothetical protein
MSEGYRVTAITYEAWSHQIVTSSLCHMPNRTVSKWINPAARASAFHGSQAFRTLDRRYSVHRARNLGKCLASGTSVDTVVIYANLSRLPRIGLTGCEEARCYLACTPEQSTVPAALWAPSEASPVVVKYLSGLGWMYAATRITPAETIPA